MVGDPRPGHAVLGVSDPDVNSINGRWTMFLGAFTTRFVVRIVEARLPVGGDIDDDSWRIRTDDRGRALHLGAPDDRGAWDYRGMHTPCFVEGWADGQRVERIYYAGRMSSRHTGSESRYAIGVLERGDDTWLRRDTPVILGDEDRPSALEPRVVFAGGVWRIWFLSTVGEVGPGEQPDYELRYSESTDGLSWGPSEIFAGRRDGFFDNAVNPHGGAWEMILARGTNLFGTQPYPDQGLWWAVSTTDPGGRGHWTSPVMFLDTDSSAEAWYAAGVCGPSFVRVNASDHERMHVFATGTRGPTSWWSAAVSRLRAGRRPPPPSPFYLAVGRLTFVRDGASRG